MTEPASIYDTILENRSYFVAYNIARLRELIRYLPKKKLEMFVKIPFLLHINAPDWPGFVDDGRTPFGIYGFFNSGFWKLAKERLGAEHNKIRSFIANAFYIKGVYLMGSAGSLGQNAYSDFDYWIVVDGKRLDAGRRNLLREKLGRIEAWATREYDHAVTFFVLDSRQVIANDFSGMAEEGLRIAQQTILKEEFYRTFILIAGQIPLWAVVPVGISEAEYRQWIDAIPRVGGTGFDPHDYIDLGHLETIDKTECLGAVLWQFCKAQDDPVKALIKASLLVDHGLFQHEDGLLCDVTKERMSNTQLDSYLLDPYAFVFERVLRFYEKIGDRDGLQVIKTCIFLRITGYPTPCRPRGDNPKKWLLERYIRLWAWTDEEVTRLFSYPQWTEDEKLVFENMLSKKLWFLYQKLLRSDAGPDSEKAGEPEHLMALKNKASSQLKKKDGKLPWASHFLRSREGEYPLYILFQDRRWGVYDGTITGLRSAGRPFFAAPELLRVLGWIVLNGLYSSEGQTVSGHSIKGPVGWRRVVGLLDAVSRHFPRHVDPAGFRQYRPAWHRVFVALDTSRCAERPSLASADLLLQNTWGEFFFENLVLGPCENRLLKYHAVAESLCRYHPGGDVPGFFRVFDVRAVVDLTAEEKISELVEEIRRKAPAGSPLKGPGHFDGTNAPETAKASLILDLL